MKFNCPYCEKSIQAPMPILVMKAAIKHIEESHPEQAARETKTIAELAKEEQASN